MVCFERFCGIDTRGDIKNELGSSYISNFRITSDGSLKKRYGYKPIFNFTSPIRAIWTGRLGGVFKGFALVGSEVLRLDFKDYTYATVGTASTSQGDASFFYYRSRLYLMDGSKIYVVSDNNLSYPFGYIPLVGKDWRENIAGEAHEAKNLLCDRVRISYIIENDSTAYLKTADDILSIDAVFINGIKASEDRYSLISLPKTVLVKNLKAGDNIVICYRYKMPEHFSDELVACNKAIVFGGINNSRPFVWGTHDKSVMFNAAYVSNKSLYASRACIAESDELYFPYGHEFTVGDGRYPINAVLRHYDRLLIFTEGGAWMADSSACGIEEFPVMRINSSTGVTSADAAVMAGNEPCTVGKSSIYKWSANTDELDECNAYSISDEVNSLLPEGFFTDAFAFYDNQKRELLFGSKSLGDKILVYSTDAKAWSFFEGIEADGFIDCGSDVGFTSTSKIYVFDRALDVDLNNGEKPIFATFKTNTLDFGTLDAKHLSSVEIKHNVGTLGLELFFDGDNTPACSVSLGGTSALNAIRKRLAAKRFRYARLVLNASDRSKKQIYSLCLHTRKEN